MTSPTLLDLNALLALCMRSHQFHQAAHRFLREQAEWATCPLTEAGLYRLVLNPAVTRESYTARDVDVLLAGVRTDPRWQFLTDDSSLARPLVDTSVLVSRNQVTDLHLVNLAARHGAVLATFDRSLLSWLAPADREYIEVIPV